MSGPSFLYDDTQWPLIVVTGLALLDEDIDKLRRDFERLLSQRRRFVVLYDGRQSGKVTVSVCHETAEWLRAHAEPLTRCCAGWVCALPRPYQRFAMSLLFAIFSPPFPYAICTDLRDARSAAERYVEGLRVRASAPPG